MERGKVIDWNGIQIKPSIERSWDTTWRVSIYLYMPAYAGGYMLFSRRGILSEDDAITIYNEQITAVIKSFKDCLIKGVKKKNEDDKSVQFPEEADEGDRG